MTDNTVEIAIKAADQTQAAVDKAKANLSSLTGAAQQAGAKAGQGLSQGFAVSEREIGQAISRINPMLGSIVTAVGPVGVAIAGATAAVVAFTQAWKLAEQGAATSELADKFNQIGGGIGVSQERLEALRKAAQGTVTDFDLMVISNRALNMGITTSTSEMARLVAYFKDLGEASGMGSQESISSGMQALGALQTRGLKTLGLSLDDTKIWDAYAAKLGTVASKLDDTQKRAALVQAILASAPAGLLDAASSSADKVDAMHVAVKNMNTAIGQSIQGMLGLGDAVTIVANKIASQLQRNLTSQEILLPYVNYVSKMNEFGTGQKFRLTADMALLESQFRAGKLSVDEYSAALQALIPQVLNNANATEYFAQASFDGALYSAQMAVQLGLEADAAIVAAQGLEAAALATQRLRGEYTIGWANVYAAGGFVEGASPWAMGMSASGGAPKAMSKSWGTLTKAPSVGGGLSDYEQAAKQAASELRSLVEELLSPTEITSMDMAATKAGTYADKWDEYARRMKSIAADQGSVWRQMVPQDILAQGEDAIKAWADQQQKAFYSGQKPGEINWESFIANAREVVAAKAAKEAMISEAMSRLAGAGIGLGATEAAGMLGLGAPGAVTGSEMATSFSAGLVSTDTASAVTKAFQEQMQAQQETWSSVGVLCIGWFVVGLKKGITPQAMKDIVEALWPGISAKIAEGQPLP